MTAAVPTMAPPVNRELLINVRDRWAAQWPEALALWGPFLRLGEPTWCLDADDEADAGINGSFAMIRLVEQRVVISLAQVHPTLVDFPLEILGHEIGHHVLCPGDLSDNARMLARLRRALPTVETAAPMIGNLYGDLLINDRLQRARGLDMAGVYAAIGATTEGPSDRLWTFYLRIYEVLWSLAKGSLAGSDIDERIESDAVLGARLVRVFGTRWLDGAGRFGALCLPYLIDPEHPAAAGSFVIWQDATTAGAGGWPDGLTTIDPDELVPARHPAFDPELNGVGSTREGHGSDDKSGPASDGPAPPQSGTATGSSGQARELYEYGQVLGASGVALTPAEVAIRYYRERARAHVVPFPHRRSPVSTEPLAEGVEAWDVGEPLAAIDWTESAMRSPILIPGITTVQRQWGTVEGAEPARVPVDLDLYVDSSGSMPDPRASTSYLALAGTIVALSALRAGGRVQVTLWSGIQQVLSTDGFVRDQHAILAVLTGFFGGGTAFPLPTLRDTYVDRRPSEPPAHVLVISDDGVTTMFERDERGTDGREVSNGAIDRAGGGATMVLNLRSDPAADPLLVRAQEDGWDIHAVRDWSDLVDFARAFSRSAMEEVR